MSTISSITNSTSSQSSSSSSSSSSSGSFSSSSSEVMPYSSTSPMNNSTLSSLSSLSNPISSSFSGTLTPNQPGAELLDFLRGVSNYLAQTKYPPDEVNRIEEEKEFNAQLASVKTRCESYYPNDRSIECGNLDQFVPRLLLRAHTNLLDRREKLAIRWRSAEHPIQAGSSEPVSSTSTLAQHLASTPPSASRSLSSSLSLELQSPSQLQARMQVIRNRISANELEISNRLHPLLFPLNSQSSSSSSSSSSSGSFSSSSSAIGSSSSSSRSSYSSLEEAPSREIPSDLVQRVRPMQANEGNNQGRSSDQRNPFSSPEGISLLPMPDSLRSLFTERNRRAELQRREVEIQAPVQEEKIGQPRQRQNTNNRTFSSAQNRINGDSRFL